VAGVVGRFIEAPLLWMDAFERDGVPFQAWPIIEPDPAHYRYDNPVVVLINGASLSAGEIFPEVMKQLPNVTLVGDTTAGAGCNDYEATSGDLRLPSGRLIHIPTACLGLYAGGLLEWNGVSPDIRVPMTASDVAAGVDVQLEAAMGLLGEVFGGR
jgi:C-terminal processing protease CtpA/Prc